MFVSHEDIVDLISFVSLIILPNQFGCAKEALPEVYT